MNPNTWHKSSYSGTSSGNCLETRWTKSSYSGGSTGNCIECRTTHDHVLIRDTQHRHLGHLEVPSAEWRALLGAVRRGELG
jgi:hypothetical protein